MLNKIFILLFVTIVFNSCIFAKDPILDKDTIIVKDSLFVPKINNYNFSEFWNETGLFIKSPAKWKGKDWLILAAVAGGTYLTLQYDQRVRNIALDNQLYVNSIPVQIGDQWGGFYVIPAATILLLSHGWMTDNHTTKKLGFEIAQAAIYSEAISFTAKGIVGRSRPFTNAGAYDFNPFTFFNSPHNSFPAGHIDYAFAVSTVLARNTKSVFLKVLAFTPSALTVVSRIITDSHWASDVFVGAALGCVVGNWVVNLHEKKESLVQISSVYPLSLRIAIK